MNEIIALIIIIGFFQLPLYIDAIIIAFPNNQFVTRFAHRFTRPIFLLLFYTAIGLLFQLWFGIYLQLWLHMLHVDLYSIPSFLLSFLTAYLLWMTVMNYTITLLTPPLPLPPAPPSTTSSSKTLNPEKVEPETNSTTSRRLSNSDKESHSADRVCQHCLIIKTPRTHHCHVCRRCIIAMDHHCPFTACCIGRHNFRSFFLWLTFLSMGLVYSCILSASPFYYCVLQFNGLPTEIESGITFDRSISASEWLEIPSTASLFTQPYCEEFGMYSLAFVPCFLAAFSVVVLYFFEVYLLASNQTTIEFLATRLSLLNSNPTKRAKFEQLRRLAMQNNRESKTISSIFRGPDAPNLSRVLSPIPFQLFELLFSSKGRVANKPN